MDISVVIPTCNRKNRLLSLLAHLNQSLFSFREIIIVDSSDDDKKLVRADYEVFEKLAVRYVESKKSVCLQRNTGISLAQYPWIFLCDDDIEVPMDYIQKLAKYSIQNPKAGAISGLVMEKSDNQWSAAYPVNSAIELVWKFIFQLSIWGEIRCKSNNILLRKIRRYYQGKGNHLSQAGWPVITNFSGEHFTTPVYGLGASLVRKSWLIDSPYDERLDKHGIGDNYGVAAGFEKMEIHVVTDAWVYHHKEQTNRLQKPVQYLSRVLALDYFISSNTRLRTVKKSWFLWSLTGNLLAFILTRDIGMIKSAFKAVYLVSTGQNRYLKKVL